MRCAVFYRDFNCKTKHEVIEGEDELHAAKIMLENIFVKEISNNEDYISEYKELLSEYETLGELEEDIEEIESILSVIKIE